MESNPLDSRFIDKFSKCDFVGIQFVEMIASHNKEYNPDGASTMQTQGRAGLVIGSPLLWHHTPNSDPYANSCCIDLMAGLHTTFRY